MLGVQLLRRRAHRLSPPFWSSAEPIRLDAVYLRGNLTVAIALDEQRRNVEVQQICNRFPAHGSRNDIAADNDLFDFRLANILNHRFDCGEVGVNIINRSNAHELAPRDRESLGAKELTESLTGMESRGARLGKRALHD